MYVPFADISGKAVVSSGVIIARDNDDVFLLPFSDDPSYRIKLLLRFVDESELPDLAPNKSRVSGFVHDDHFVVSIVNKWPVYTLSPEAVLFDLAIATSESYEHFINLHFTTIGSREKYAITYNYMIYRKPVEAAP